MGNEELIAEARGLLTCDGLGEHFPYAFSLITRLAAALEEATVPEGWRVTEYENEDGVRVYTPTEQAAWTATMRDGKPLLGWAVYPTAHEAMAALDTQKAPPLKLK